MKNNEVTRANAYAHLAVDRLSPARYERRTQEHDQSHKPVVYVRRPMSEIKQRLREEVAYSTLVDIAHRDIVGKTEDNGHSL